ncbi:hypothetical protein Emed_000458 [Eimeria media]
MLPAMFTCFSFAVAPGLVLDLGFGCGMSGAVVSEKGHFVVGLDISRAMLCECLSCCCCCCCCCRQSSAAAAVAAGVTLLQFAVLFLLLLSSLVLLLLTAPLVALNRHAKSGRPAEAETGNEAQDLENTYNADTIQTDLGKRPSAATAALTALCCWCLHWSPPALMSSRVLPIFEVPVRARLTPLTFYFRPGSFDGAISISAIQWLCSDIKSDLACGVHTLETQADATAADSGSSSGDEDMDEDGSVEQQQRLLLLQQKQEQQRRKQLRPTPPASAYRRQTCFFQHLARALRPGARAALQFYPDNAEQLESLTSAALRCGFEGGLVVDYPNSTKAKKANAAAAAVAALVCLLGGARHKTQQMPKALGTSAILNAGRERPIVSGRRAKKLISKREWIAKKKEQQKMKNSISNSEKCGDNSSNSSK